MATTAAGKVSGRVENGINVFRGIPSGEDTRKTPRIKAPMTVAAWSGVKKCVEWSTQAPQLSAERSGGGQQERVGFHLPRMRYAGKIPASKCVDAGAARREEAGCAFLYSRRGLQQRDGELQICMTGIGCAMAGMLWW